MLEDLTLQQMDPERWFSLTDQYAEALDAMQRGEPLARERVLAVYQKLRHLTPLNDSERWRA